MKTSIICQPETKYSTLIKMMFDTLVCPLSSDLEDEEERKDSFEIFKGSTKSLCEEVLQTKT